MSDLSEATVREQSRARDEPDWLVEFRVESFRQFQIPATDRRGAALSAADIDSLVDDASHVDDGHMGGSLRPDARTTTAAEHEGVSERGGRDDRAGRIARKDSDTATRLHHEELAARGVLFTDIHTAVREHPELVRSHLGSIVSPDHSRFAALNSAVWAGGTFIYVPPGVHVGLPLQSPARRGSEATGPFERTLIVADEGSTLEYLEGCASPIYTSRSLHSPVVEVVVRPGASVTYTTIQNWSSNVVDIGTKRAVVEADGHLSWIDANIGGRLGISHPSVWLAGSGARGEATSVAIAADDQRHDVGAEMVHLAPNTSSSIELRTISTGGGRSSRRSLVRVGDRTTDCRSVVRYDSLALDDDAVFDSHPVVERSTGDVSVDHRARVSTVDEHQRFYLASRGLSDQQATAMIVNGFIEPVTRRLPMEFAVEWNRLIEHQIRS